MNNQERFVILDEEQLDEITGSAGYYSQSGTMTPSGTYHFPMKDFPDFAHISPPPLSDLTKISGMRPKTNRP